MISDETVTVCATKNFYFDCHQFGTKVRYGWMKKEGNQ
jgi:hypothetical protein